MRKVYVATGIATAVKKRDIIGMSLTGCAAIILHVGILFFWRDSQLFFIYFLFFWVAKIFQKRSVCGHEMKKCNAISGSFSVQNEHSSSSRGESHSHTYEQPGIHSSRSPGTVVWRGAAHCSRAL